MKPIKVEITFKTILFILVIIASVALISKLYPLIVIFYICLVLMGALNPLVTRLQQHKIPRPLSILLIYLLVFAVASFGLAAVIPILIEQTNSLIVSLPSLASNLTIFGTNAVDLSSQLRLLETLPSSLAKLTLGVFSNVFNIFIIFISTYYLLLERQKLDDYSYSFFGNKGKRFVHQFITEFEARIGRWVIAEMILMLLIGVLTYIGLALLSIPFAVPLAIIAGFLELVPNIGPTISTLLASLVGLTLSPYHALFAAIWGIVVQQLENNFIVPKVMNSTIGLNPIITIFILIAGSMLGGVTGAILSIPIYLTIEIILRLYSQNISKTDKNKIDQKILDK